MKTSINLKTRKMKNNYLKLGMMAAVMLSASIGFAQRTGTTAAPGTNFTKEVNTVLGTDGGSVKVIDNKGTIKYLQSKNGLTTFTDLAPDGGVVTTWQLGGVLTDNTYIDASNKEFGITGITGIDEASAVADDQAATAFAGTGYTLVVRDEGSGELKKVLAADILAEAAITGILQNHIHTLALGGNLTDPASDPDLVIDVTGLQILDTTTSAKLSIYRNGVKLRFGIDFTVETDGAVAPTISVKIPKTGYADLPIYIGDVIEIQYVN
jgi:hypothetical protein